MTEIHRRSLLCGVFAAVLGSFLAGYHLGIISGALFAISEEFQLSLVEQQSCVAILLVGGLLGSMLTGPLGKRLPHRRLILCSTLFFFAGMLLLMQSPTYVAILLGRLITGLGVGLAFVTSPMYIAEIAPPDHRGTFVFFAPLAITLGIFSAYLVSYIYTPCSQWRSFIGWSILPLVLQTFLLSGAPKIAPASAARSHWKRLLAPSLRKPLVIGIGLAILQPLIGINAIIFYGPHVFQLAGYAGREMGLFATLLIGIVNVLATIFSVFLVDRLGRRPLLLTSFAGMMAALAILAASLWNGTPSIREIPVAGVLLYMAAFAIGIGPTLWLLLAEIYPKEVRAEAMGFAAVTNWLATIIASGTFLSMSEALGVPVVFLIYGVICLIAFWFVYRRVPETKGKTFEEIQALWN